MLSKVRKNLHFNCRDHCMKVNLMTLQKVLLFLESLAQFVMTAAGSLPSNKSTTFATRSSCFRRRTFRRFATGLRKSKRF